MCDVLTLPVIPCPLSPRAQDPRMADYANKVSFVGMIADEDTITGFLLAGAGHRDKKSGSNFLIVDPEKTPKEKIVEYFKTLTNRKDISLILINQHIAELIRPTLEAHTAAIPAVLEIPSKEHPYDEAKDPLMRRVKQLLGNPDD